jgi:hypothetical protein
MNAAMLVTAHVNGLAHNVLRRHDDVIVGPKAPARAARASNGSE